MVPIVLRDYQLQLLADLRTALAERGVHLDRVDVRVAGEGGRDPREGQARQSHSGHRRPGADRFAFGRIDGIGQTADPNHLAAHLGRGVSILA